MKPVYFAATAVALVAAFVLGMSVSVDSGAAGQPPQAVMPTLEAPNPDAPPAADLTPGATLEPAATATPQPPMVIYVQVPPQTIYVQVPAAAGVSDTAGLQAFATAVPTATATATPFVARAVVATATPQPPAATATPGAPSFRSAPKPEATPVMVRGTVVVNFAGTPSQRPTASVPFEVSPGQNALTAIRQAIGPSNLTFEDFGSLGVFITGFYGVQAEGNHFWEFFVNGQSSSVGVSAYIVRNGDVLEFRYSSF